MEEWFLVLDNFDGYVTFFLCIVGLHHLTKGALADQGVDFIPENIKKLEKIFKHRLLRHFKIWRQSFTLYLIKANAIPKFSV